MEATPTVPAGAGLPSAELPGRLAACLARLDPADPLRDGGEAIACLIEAGAHARARLLLDAAWPRAIGGGVAARARCHLLEALLELERGDRSAAHAQLGRALALTVDLARDPALRLLRGAVGLHVTLAINDLAEADEFVRDLQDAGTPETAGLLPGALALWTAELALRKGMVARAERLMRALPIDAKANTEPTWKSMRLRGELDLFRGEVDSARGRFEEAERVMQRIAGVLPPEFRRGYLTGSARREVGARLGEIARKGAASTVIGLPQLAVDAVPSDGLLATLGALMQGVLDLGRNGQLDALLDRVLDAMIRFADARRGLVVLVEADAVRVAHARHRDHRPLSDEELQMSRSIATRVARDGEAILLDDASASAEYGGSASVMAYQLRSVVCVPLIVEGQKRGAIYLDDPGRRSVFSPGTLAAVQVLATHAALAMEHARLLSRITRDPLTGTFTHAFLQEAIANAVSAAQRHGRSCGLLMIDLDRFKNVNDAYGHEFGNEVLRRVSQRLQEDVRGSDTLALRRAAEAEDEPAAGTNVVGRFGGDEFEILLTDTGPKGLAIVAERVLKALAEITMTAGEKRVPVSASLGGACFPQHAGDAAALFQRADEALYAAKNAGRGVFRMAGPVAP